MLTFFLFFCFFSIIFFCFCFWKENNRHSSPPVLKRKI
jgi:hypothetical protein